MLKNYLKIAFRNNLRNKVYSFISIAGLAVGMAACIVILLYVHYEFSFDKFNKDYRRIYRVAQDLKWSGKKMETAITPAKLGPALKESFPEVRNYERIYDLNLQRVVVRYRSKAHYTRDFIFADTGFFSFFGYHLVEGSTSQALSAPFSVVITQSMARKYFGQEDPIGKRVQLAIWNQAFDFTITGVAEDAPSNSSLQYQFVASFSTFYQGWWKNWSGVDYWGSSNFYTYVLLNGKEEIRTLDVKLPAFLNGLPGYREETGDMHASLVFQPLKDIHLYSRLEFDLPSDVNAGTLYILSAIAIFLLVIACVNFMNLSTARYVKRAKEIGVRKVMGAARTQLVRQFLGESMIISVIATAVAIMLVEILLPLTRDLTGNELHLSLLHGWEAPVTLGLIAISTGILAGLYPALFLSSFHPTSVLKNSMGPGGRAGLIRKGLVVFQFTISIALIISALSVERQLNYVQDFPLGFDKENIVVVPLFAPLFKEDAVSRFEVYRSEIESNPNVLSVTAASEYPGNMIMRTTLGITGEQSGKIWTNIVAVDSNYLETLKASMASGTTFSQSHTRGGVVINQSAQRELGLANPIGKELVTGWDGVHGQIIGVTKDFNFESLFTRSSPLTMVVDPEQFRYLICRIAPRDYLSTLKFLEAKWKEVYPGVPFDYSFLNADLNKLYVSEAKFGSRMNVFSGLAVMIACLGLFGLSSFSVEERTKEIGVRKVLGASVPQMALMLMKDFAGLVLLANVIAWPLAYYAMNKWLQDFAYRVNMTIWIFLIAAAIVFVIAMVTISFKAVKAAVANPAQSLRYEWY